MAINNIIYRITALDLLTPALRRINTVADTTDSTLTKMGLAATVAFAAATTGAAMMVKSVLDAGTKVQDARTGLATLLKDANAANTVIERTMEDAARTPFDFNSLLQGNKALISTGLSANRARTDILALGNAIAATGGGAYELSKMTINLQQIRNLGKASAQDLKEFGYNGINIYKLLEASTGKSVNELKKIPITYDMITEALQKAQEAGGIFEGALDRMGNNVSIKLSNIGDNLFIIYNNIFMKTSGFISNVLDGINKVLVKIKDFTASATKMRELGNTIKDIAVALGLVVVSWGAFNALTYITNLNIAKMTASMWGFVSAESAALLGIPLLIAGFTKLIDKGDEFDSHTNAMLFRLGKGWAYLASSVIYTIELIKTRSIKAASEAFDKNMAEYEKKGGDFFKIDKNIRELDRYMEAVNKIRERKISATTTKELDDDKFAMEKQIYLLAKAEKQFGKTSSSYKKIKDALEIGDLDKGDKTTVAPVIEKKLSLGVSGPKITSITINMENLIKEFKISTTNLKETSTEVKDAIITALSQALADSQAVVK